MKHFLCTFFIVTLFFSCKKDDNNSSNNNSNIPTDGFRIGTTTYTYSSCVKVGSTGLKAYTSDGSLVIGFQSLPTTNGTYGIVSGSSMSLTANQLQFSYHSTAGVYKSVLTTSTTATVTVTNGIIKVTIPETDVDLNGTTSKFAATITEK